MRNLNTQICRCIHIFWSFYVHFMYTNNGHFRMQSIRNLRNYEPQRENAYFLTWAPNEDSNQPAYLRNLISLRCSYEETFWSVLLLHSSDSQVSTVSSGGQGRLNISDSQVSTVSSGGQRRLILDSQVSTVSSGGQRRLNISDSQVSTVSSGGQRRLYISDSQVSMVSSGGQRRLNLSDS